MPGCLATKTLPPGHSATKAFSYKGLFAEYIDKLQTCASLYITIAADDPAGQGY